VAGIREQEQLQQVLSERWAERLEDVGRLSAHALVELDVQLAVGEALQGPPAERLAELRGDGFGESDVARSGKQGALGHRQPLQTDRQTAGSSAAGRHERNRAAVAVFLFARHRPTCARQGIASASCRPPCAHV
jgi:hypothetical protein